MTLPINENIVRLNIMMNYAATVEMLESESLLCDYLRAGDITRWNCLQSLQSPEASRRG